jgi:hypothetical protein
VERSQRLPRRPRRRSKKEARTYFEHDRDPAHLGRHRVHKPAANPLGFKKGHAYSMAERTSRFPEKPMPHNFATNPHLAAPKPTSGGKNSQPRKPTAEER